jgi:hypothetical protein
MVAHDLQADERRGVRQRFRRMGERFSKWRLACVSARIRHVSQLSARADGRRQVRLAGTIVFGETFFSIEAR